MLSRSIELFCDVAHCRSFSKAAESNGISQSSVSQSVAQLEKRLGIDLINRAKRPLELTPAGERYYSGCQELIDQYRQLESSLLEFTNRIAGRLRVAAIYSVGLSEMEQLVAAFQKQFPEVDLKLDYLHPEQVYERVRTDQADLGLVSFPRDSGEFACIPWQEQRFDVVVPSSHPLAERLGAVMVSELDGENFVALTPDLRVRREIDRWLRAAKVSVKVVREFDNIENVRGAVEANVGISLLPSPTVDRSVEAGTLVRLKLADVEWCRPLGIIHKRNRRLSRAADEFIEALREEPVAPLSESVGDSERTSIEKVERKPVPVLV